MVANIEFKKIKGEDNLLSGRHRCDICDSHILTILMNNSSLYNSPLLIVTCRKCTSRWCLKWEGTDLQQFYVFKNTEVYDPDSCCKRETCISCEREVFGYYGNYKSKYYSPLIYLHCNYCTEQHMIKFDKAFEPSIKISL